MRVAGAVGAARVIKPIRATFAGCCASATSGTSRMPIVTTKASCRSFIVAFQISRMMLGRSLCGATDVAMRPRTETPKDKRDRFWDVPQGLFGPRVFQAVDQSSDAQQAS